VKPFGSVSRRRRHSTLGYLCPEGFELRHLEPIAACPPVSMQSGQAHRETRFGKVLCMTAIKLLSF